MKRTIYHHIGLGAILLVFAAMQTVNAQGKTKILQTTAKIAYEGIKAYTAYGSKGIVTVQHSIQAVPKNQSNVAIRSFELPKTALPTLQIAGKEIWYTKGLESYAGGDFEAARIYLNLSITNGQNRGRAYTYLAIMENEVSSRDSLATLALRFLGKNDRLFRFQATCLTKDFAKDLKDSITALPTLYKVLSLVDEKSMPKAESITQKYYIWCMFNAAFLESDAAKEDANYQKIITYPDSSDYFNYYKDLANFNLSVNSYNIGDYERSIHHFERIKNIQAILLDDDINLYHVIYSYGATNRYEQASFLLRASTIVRPEETWDTIFCWDDAECANNTVCQNIAKYFAHELSLDNTTTAEELCFAMFHFINANDLETAYAMYERQSDKLYRTNSEIHYYAAVAKSNLGEYEKAISCCDKALSSYGKYPLDYTTTIDSADILYWRGLNFWDLCNYESALNDLNKVPMERIDGKTLAAIMTMNTFYGKYPVAIEQCNYLLEQHPSDSNESYYFCRAACHKALGLIDKAAEDYHRIIDDKEYRHWALLFFNKSEAESAMKLALKNSTEAIDYIDASQFYLEKGKIRKAKKMLKIASSIEKFDKCAIKRMRYAFKGTALENYFNQLFPSE